MKNDMCIGCRHYTNAPDGDWHCSRISCVIHERLAGVKEVRRQAKELGLRPDIVKTDEEIIAEEKKIIPIDNKKTCETCGFYNFESQYCMGPNGEDKCKAPAWSDPSKTIFQHWLAIAEDKPSISFTCEIGEGKTKDFHINLSKEEGTKFDAGKPRLGEMIQDFRKPLLEVCKVWEFGADKYAKSNWKKVENGEDRYTNALARHFAAEMDEGIDAETKLHHAIHVAWNGLARLYFIIKDGE